MAGNFYPVCNIGVIPAYSDSYVNAATDPIYPFIIIDMPGTFVFIRPDSYR